MFAAVLKARFLFMVVFLQINLARRDLDELKEELEIAGLDPKEAHAKFLKRVNDHKQVRVVFAVLGREGQRWLSVCISLH